MTTAPLLTVDCWLVDVRGLSAEQTTRWDDAEPEQRERAAVLATFALRGLTAGAVEPCAYLWHPARACGCEAPTWAVYPVVGHGSTFTPRLDAGTWINVRCGACGWFSGDFGGDEVRLPGATAVASVTVEGTILDPSAYALTGELLRRLDSSPWPVAPDDLEVRYYRTRPGTAGEQAAGRLALEYLAALTGGSCVLPSTVTTVARAGVTITKTPGAFPGGLTGVREVDAWVAMVNPNRLTAPSQVLSPDLSR